MYLIMRSNNERDDHKLNFDLWSKLFKIRPYYKSTRRYRDCFGTPSTPRVTFNILEKFAKISNHDSDKTFHEKIPNELKTSVEDPIKTVIKRNLDTVNENANIVRKRLNIFLRPVMKSRRQAKAGSPIWWNKTVFQNLEWTVTQKLTVWGQTVISWSEW